MMMRLKLQANGVVQGVGFRPFICRLARSAGVSGSIANSSGAAAIEIQGSTHAIRQFLNGLQQQLPPGTVLRSLQIDELPVLSGARDFEIQPSESATSSIDAIEIIPDLAICPKCLDELQNKFNRRFGHALITCTHCGPRFSIMFRTPYDRHNTSMREFALCPDCMAEYTSPTDRRFHAQPVSCLRCGPRVTLVDPAGELLRGDAVARAQEMLRAGKILAIKGLGGFHLAVRADDSIAVARLRTLKHRPAKPLAVMAGNLRIACSLARLSENAQAAMLSPRAPIMVAPRIDPSLLSANISPGNSRIGLLLPYTPLHHLLFAEDMPPLVMTSANDNGEPMVIDNDDALRRLHDCCDAILWHDRPIVRGADDSVLLEVTQSAPILLRRSRGYAPEAITFHRSGTSPGLAIGGELKNCFALVRDHDVVLSPHMGDLGDVAAFGQFRDSIEDLQALFQITPQWVACDLHPTYLSSRHAVTLSRKAGVPLFSVQHHHAHAASVIAEAGLKTPVLAVICDGTGYGTDGTIWGGELLQADLKSFRRLARLRPLRLPGGDAAARSPARCAMAMLYSAFGPDAFDSDMAQRLIPKAEDREILAAMIAGNHSCALSSGAGRYFDAIAALIGFDGENTYEAQAAIALEAAADQFTESLSSQPLFELKSENAELTEINFDPLVQSIVASSYPADTLHWAATFHEHFARAWAAAVEAAAHATGICTVVLSGGVFCNARLLQRLTELLETRELAVYRNIKVPPNDGGLALGQAAIAAALMDSGEFSKGGA